MGGMRIERECLLRLEDGCRALVINFKGTELVNSIGVSILLGVIEEAARKEARVVFAGASRQTVKLFDMLGLTRHVSLARAKRPRSPRSPSSILKPPGPDLKEVNGGGNVNR